MNKFIMLLCSMAMTGIADSGLLTLEQALERAHQNSPALRAAQMHVQVAEKNMAAAGMWKNPQLKLEAEGVGWDNDLFSDGEYTLQLSQPFQLGGKQEKERSAALKAVEIAGYAVAENQLELFHAVRKAFIEIVYLQESAKVQAEQEELGRAFVEVAKRRHQVGGGSELEVVQAELELEKILFAQTCCLGEMQAAQEKLASLMGVPLDDFPELAAPYYELEELEHTIPVDTHPALRRLTAEIEKLRTEAQRAKAQDTPDVSLGAGYKYEAAGEINTFVFSAAIPLSFNRRGRIEQAAGLMRADAVQAQRDEVRRKLHADLAEALALYKGARMQAEMGRVRLIPKAEQAYELSRAGYEAGRFSWFELIAAQQHLAEIRVGYIEALREAHLARIEVLKFKAEGMVP